MNENPDRVEQFQADIAEMRVRDPSAARDRVLVRLGAALMVGGVVTGIVAYLLSHSTLNPLQQRDAIVLAAAGVAAAVVGAALYVRHSLTTYLRFWLARLVYEQKAQTDRLVDAVQDQ